jgi:hypothetical protein
MLGVRYRINPRLEQFQIPMSSHQRMRMLGSFAARALFLQAGGAKAKAQRAASAGPVVRIDSIDGERSWSGTIERR